MLIEQKIGNSTSVNMQNRVIDWLDLEWFETNKRILHKRTRSGKAITLKFLEQNPALTQGDVLYEDDTTVIAVTILPCEVIAIKAATVLEMASVCYEIGNKHLPLFFHADEVLVPFDQPLFRLLTTQGYQVRKDLLPLINPFKTTVSPHAHSKPGLFTKIMQLTNTTG
jgi:urease accessory protein